MKTLCNVQVNSVNVNKIINKKYHSVGTIPISNRKIVETDEINTLSTHIHDRPFSWLGTGISLISGRV